MDETATTGTGTREPRDLNEVMMSFDLGQELDRLRHEPGYREDGRTAITLGKGDHVGLVLAALRDGATVGSEHADGAVAIQVLTGQVTVGRSERTWTYPAGTAIWMSRDGPWHLEAAGETAILLTIGRPGPGKAVGAGEDGSDVPLHEIGQRR